MASATGSYRMTTGWGTKRQMRQSLNLLVDGPVRAED